jgi:hypothetical protein
MVMGVPALTCLAFDRWGFVVIGMVVEVAVAFVVVLKVTHYSY